MRIHPSIVDRRRPWRDLTHALAALGVLTTVALTMPGTAHADPSDTKPAEVSDVGELVDAVVPKQLADGAIPGAIVTVVADGETVFSQGYGDADIAAGTAMDAETTGFYTASEAKLFAATAALQLVEQGKLDPQADVNDYLSEFSVPDSYPGRPITVHNLMTYTSGFDYNVYGWSQWDYQDMPSLADFTEQMLPERVRPPGELVAYNNFDFILLGLLIEIASGSPYAEYVADNVFEPLGMTATSSAQPHPRELEETLATGYRPDGDSQAETAGQNSPVTSSGADTVSSSADMARFMIAQLEHDPALGDGVAAAMQRQQFTTDERMPGVGYAFEEHPRNGQPVWFKDGDLPGNHNNLALLPEAKIGIHVVYNGDGTDGAAFWGGKDLINQIIDEYFPAESAEPVGIGGDVSGFAGEYADSRTSHTSFARVLQLLSPITVEATADGTLTTTGLSQDPSQGPQEWVQVASGQFDNADGNGASIAFTSDGVLVNSQTPGAAFTPLAWYESPALHLMVFGVATVALIVGFFWLPIQLLVRRFRGRQPHPAGAKIARVTAWTVSLCAVMVAVGFSLVSADGNRMMQVPLTGDPILSITLNTVTVMALTAIGTVVAAALGWWRGWWTLKGRIGYTLIAVASIGFVAVAINYRLIGLPYTLTV